MPTIASEVIFSILKKFVWSGIFSWINCLGLCTDGVTVVKEKKSAHISRVKYGALEVKLTHCMLHCEDLPAKKL